MLDPRIEAAVWALTWKLRGRVPGQRRREIRRALRADLLTTAAAVGSAAAVLRLGSLDELAAAYAEDERRRPCAADSRAGVIAATAV